MFERRHVSDVLLDMWFASVVWLNRSPAAANWVLVFAKDYFKQLQKSDRPAVDQRMADKYA